MRLWILSDLHLEQTRGWDLPMGEARPDFDVMIVAGDLITRMERGVKWLFERVPDRRVIYIAGNHEPYGQDIDRDLEKARAAAVSTSIHVMQNDSITINGMGPGASSRPGTTRTSTPLSPSKSKRRRQP